MKRKLFFEDVKERYGGRVIISTNHPASKQEIKIAKELHKKGKCPHNIFYDEKGFMYDLRFCGTCGAGLGFI